MVVVSNSAKLKPETVSHKLYDDGRFVKEENETTGASNVNCLKFDPTKSPTVS